jgi:hypothetical protein
MTMITLEQLDAKLDEKFTVFEEKFDKKLDHLEAKFDEKIDNLARSMAQEFTEVHIELRAIKDNYVTKDDLRGFAEKIESNFRHISLGI